MIIKCECGRYIDEEEIFKTYTGIDACPYCSMVCSNCGEIISEKEYLANTNKCMKCDEEY